MIGFSRNLRHWREERGLRRADLAALVGLSPATIESYELEYRDPSMKSLTALAKALDVEVAALVTEGGEGA